MALPHQSQWTAAILLRILRSIGLAFFVVRPPVPLFQSHWTIPVQKLLPDLKDTSLPLCFFAEREMISKYFRFRSFFITFVCSYQEASGN